MGTLFFLTLITAFGAANLLWWRVVDRRLRSMRQRAWRIALACLVVAMLGYVVAIGSMGAGRSLPMPIHTFAYLWNLLVLPIALICMGMVALGAKVFKRKDAASSDPAPDTADLDEPTRVARRSLPTRRRVLGMAAAVVPPLVAVGMTGVAEQALGTFRIRRITLPVAGLPPDLDGLTICQVTDVHIGRFLPDGTLPKILDAVHGLNADVVVFTGDVLDASQRDIGPGIEFLQALRPTDGRPYAIVEGNHDVAHGAELFESGMIDADLPLLLDSSIVMHASGRSTPLRLCGITWGTMVPGRALGQYGEAGRRMTRKCDDPAMADSVAKVAADRQPGEFPLLLVHHPHAFDPAVYHGFPVTLAGHTHGGQIMLTPNIGAGPIRFRYWSGTHVRNHSVMFISNGVGNWFPLRINAPTEIVHITLRDLQNI